jgi:hypothetical protein
MTRGWQNLFAMNVYIFFIGGRAVKIAILCCTILILGGLSPEAQDKSDDGLYIFFGNNPDFLFLKGLNKKITEARSKQNTLALCAYAALVFYAENISSKKDETCDGVTLLREATSIAWEKEDIRALTCAQALWSSKFFGLNDKKGAAEIQKFIEEIKKKKKEKPSTSDHSPQKILLAEEYARLDAVERIAESIFGVIIQSVTETKDYVTTRDVVVATLKTSLLIGAKFETMQIKGDEVHIPVVITKDQVLASIKYVLTKQGKQMSSVELKKLEGSLQEEYRAIGIGIISKD